MAPKNFDMFGIQELYRPPQEPADVDIVAVHGLNGDSIKTWTYKLGNICWLSHPDFLPKYVKNARVLSWGYNANICSMFGGGSNRILQHAQTLVADLQADRELEDANTRPIVFLCHSLGGIIVKQALIYSASRTAPNIAHLHEIYTCTSSIVFFGTPHLGTSKAHLLAGTLQRLASLIIPKGMVRFEYNLLEALDENSETFQGILDQFAPLMSNFHIFFFWEQEMTDFKYRRDYIVNETSAAPIVENTERSGIAADHRGMCRFESNTSPGFRTTMAALRRYRQEAPQLIKARHAMTTVRLNQSRLDQALETMNAIGNITEDADTWKAAMDQTRQLRDMETAATIDTITGNPGAWKSGKLLESRQTQNAIAENHETSKTVRLIPNLMPEGTIKEHPETIKPEITNKNRELRVAETTNAIDMVPEDLGRRKTAGMNETRILQQMGVEDTYAVDNSPIPPAEEPSYSPKHESRDSIRGFQLEYSAMRQTVKLPWTVRMIALCFSIGMVAAIMTYFLLENLHRANQITTAT